MNESDALKLLVDTESCDDGVCSHVGKPLQNCSTSGEFYFFIALVFDSQRLRNYLKNYKTLGASWLVQKLCWKVSK